MSDKNCELTDNKNQKITKLLILNKYDNDSLDTCVLTEDTEDGNWNIKRTYNTNDECFTKLELRDDYYKLLYRHGQTNGEIKEIEINFSEMMELSALFNIAQRFLNHKDCGDSLVIEADKAFSIYGRDSDG